MQTTNKQRILEAIGWSEQEYANFIYETGIAYLEHYIPNDAHGMNMLIRSRVFWNWWKNHWQQRDEQFVSVFDISGHAKALERIYRSANDVYTLVNEIFPNAVILGDSYATMIGHFHKSEA